MKRVNLTLTARRQLARDVFELSLTGDASAITRPGQFVNIRLQGLYLRRPISVCDWTADRLKLIFKVVGTGTAALRDAAHGTVFDVLTGLGNGYDIEKTTASPILIGGGAGVPPLYGLAKALLAKGIAPVVALGFGAKAEVFYEEEFRALGCRTLVSTVDGSCGEQGFVTALAAKTCCDYVFCCGPAPMLKAVYGLEQLRGGQFSFEERMGCGFGACVGCTCETRYGHKRICKDGPVLDKEEIVW